MKKSLRLYLSSAEVITKGREYKKYQSPNRSNEKVKPTQTASSKHSAQGDIASEKRLHHSWTEWVSYRSSYGRQLVGLPYIFFTWNKGVFDFLLPISVIWLCCECSRLIDGALLGNKDVSFPYLDVHWTLQRHVLFWSLYCEMPLC